MYSLKKKNILVLIYFFSSSISKQSLLLLVVVGSTNRQYGCNNNDAASNATDSYNTVVARNDRRNGNSNKYSNDDRRRVATYDNRAIVPVATYRTYGRLSWRNVIRTFSRTSAEYYVANVDVDEMDLPILFRNKPDRPNYKNDARSTNRADRIDRNSPVDVSMSTDIIPIKRRPYEPRLDYVSRLNWPYKMNRVRIDRRHEPNVDWANTYLLVCDSI